MPAPNTRWYASTNFIPHQPYSLNIVGEVEVGNPGIHAELVCRRPQGVNRQVLYLDLNLVQQLGDWTHEVIWIPTSYEKILASHSTRYNQVEIFFEDDSIAVIPVHSTS